MNWNFWEAISNYTSSFEEPHLATNNNRWDRGCSHGMKQPQRKDPRMKKIKRKMAKLSRRKNRAA